jgi:hypothetical protein
VTSAQRARLVVAMGLLNLILATVALTAGLIAPAQPDGGIAVGASSQPSPSAPGSSSEPAGASPSTSGASASPTTPSASESTPPASSSPTPSSEPSASPTESAPTVAQGPTPTPAATPVVVRTPAPSTTPHATPTPRPTSRPTATPPTPPTPKPTTNPTARPTPAPTPTPIVVKAKKPMPPCPTAGGGPPGHHKGEGSTTRPCGSKNDHGKGGSGVVIVLPLALLGAAATGRRRLGAGIRRVHGLTGRRSA